ncbi:MAG: hypothetical protein LBL79_06150 [Prevotella sp.]|jgi:hypothetical protein|nr:hypothetical protein [Prevotella sp.]
MKKMILTKTLKFLLFAVLALSMGVACSKDDMPEEKLELPGTKWKLADIRNLATGELRTLEPHRPDGQFESFSFTFEDDTIGRGRSCTNGMFVNIKGTTHGRYLGIMTMVYEGTGDCYYFSDVLPLVDDCFFEKDQLIFAYTQDDVRYHLRFKQVKDGPEVENPLTDLP